eukprot:5569074-Prymnesium_polylepis.1
MRGTQLARGTYIWHEVLLDQGLHCCGDLTNLTAENVPGHGNPHNNTQPFLSIDRVAIVEDIIFGLLAAKLQSCVNRLEDGVQVGSFAVLVVGLDKVTRFQKQNVSRLQAEDIREQVEHGFGEGSATPHLSR